MPTSAPSAPNGPWPAVNTSSAFGHHRLGEVDGACPRQAVALGRDMGHGAFLRFQVVAAARARPRERPDAGFDRAVHVADPAAGEVGPREGDAAPRRLQVREQAGELARPVAGVPAAGVRIGRPVLPAHLQHLLDLGDVAAQTAATWPRR